MKQSIQASLEIDTPENIAFQYRVAGIGSRFLAAMIDSLIIFLIQIIILGTTILIWFAQFRPDLQEQPSSWLIAILALIGFIVLWGYYIYFEVQWNGKSPGKRVVGLQVIRNDGTPITLTDSLIRNLIRLIDFLPTNYAIGVLSMFIDHQSRRLGDLAAGTLVILEKSKVTLEGLEQVTQIANIQVRRSISTDWPLDRLGDQDLDLIERFLHRRDELSNREALASQILRPIMEKMGLSSDQVLQGQSEAALIEIAAALRSKQE